MTTPVPDTFPLPSTVTRDRGSVAEPTARLLLQALSQQFRILVPELRWSRTRGGTYFPTREQIRFGPNSYRGVDVLLHEFAHHLQKAEKYAALKPAITGSRHYGTTRRSIHGPDFFAALLDVVTFAYGGEPRHYSWHREYKAIAKKFRVRFGWTTHERPIYRIPRWNPEPAYAAPKGKS